MKKTVNKGFSILPNRHVTHYGQNRHVITFINSEENVLRETPGKNFGSIHKFLGPVVAK